MSVNEQVLKTLQDSGDAMRPGAIAESLGVDKKEVDKAIKALKADGSIHSPKRCFYAAS